MTRFERAASSSQVTRINQIFPHTDMEQVKGIEPSSSIWQANILPLNYTYMEPVKRIERSSSAWKAVIIAIIRHRQYSMVRYIACNSKAVSFSSICICPEKVYKPKLFFYSISQPNHLHLLLYNNFYSLYIIYINFFCVFYFLLAVRVELTNYTSRANM